jgi:hypothetical protein
MPLIHHRREFVTRQRLHGLNARDSRTLLPLAEVTDREQARRLVRYSGTLRHTTQAEA